MTPDAFARVVFDVVMRAVANALPKKIKTAVETAAEPMAREIGTLTERVERLAGSIVALVPRKDFEEAHARTMQAFADCCRAELQAVVASLKIEANADGFLFLKNDGGASVDLGFRPLQYQGVYDDTRRYFENDVVTIRGCMWVAREKALGVAPGTDEGAGFWTLAVKSGRDGKTVQGNGRADNG